MKFIIDFIRKLLGLGSANSAQASLDQLQVLKQRNLDSLEALKDQIRDLVARIGQKKAELDDAKIPALKRTVEREIGELLNEVERLKTRDDYISRNTTRISKLVEKHLQNQIAREQGASEDMLLDLSIDTEEVLAGMEGEDRAMEQLESRQYRPLNSPQTEATSVQDVSLDERLRSVGIDAPKSKADKKPDLDIED